MYTNKLDALLYAHNLPHKLNAHNFIHTIQHIIIHIHLCTHNQKDSYLGTFVKLHALLPKQPITHKDRQSRYNVIRSRFRATFLQWKINKYYIL
jgi:hypothetical protein